MGEIMSMKKQTILKILLVSLLTSAFFLQAAYGAEKSTIIKLATLAPEGSSWMKTFNTLNTEVMKKTEKRVQFKIYPGMILGDEMDMLRKMKIGQIQAAALTSGGLSALFREINVLQIPFLFQKYQEVDAILTRMDSFFKNGFEDNGYVLLSWSEGGFIYLMSTLPISSVSDLQKAKVRCPGWAPDWTGQCRICPSDRSHLPPVVHESKIFDQCPFGLSGRRNCGK